MAFSATASDGLAARLQHIGAQVDGWVRDEVEALATGPAARLGDMLAYHFGLRDETLGRASANGTGGKKLRPAMALLVCEAVCGSPEPARAAAVAVELVHNFSLVHDDIQDHSELRRHRPTVWKLWGPEQAINVGDALFALAQVVLARAGAPEAAEMVLRLNETCLRLVEGQYLDLEMQRGGVAPTLETYQAMIARKTAVLFACCAELGAIAGGASQERQAAFAAFAHHLGIAFQEQDDLLGVWGTEAETGKPRAADVVERKRGLPAVLALGQPEAPAWLRDLYSDSGPMPARDVERVIAYLDARGIAADVAQRVEHAFTAATAALREARPSGEAGVLLAAIGDALRSRRT